MPINFRLIDYLRDQLYLHNLLYHNDNQACLIHYVNKLVHCERCQDIEEILNFEKKT